MSSTEQRLPLREAQALAERLVSELQDVCEKIEIAGSIRRQRPDVGDLEIVCLPKIETIYGGLFGDVAEVIDRLDDRIAAWLEAGLVRHRLDKNLRKAAGKRYRRLLYHDVPLDLFSPAPESFGAILAIRTGPAAYSHALVTPKNQYTTDGVRGLLPEFLQMKDGALRWREGGEVVDTPTEKLFFHTIGVPLVAPELRGVDQLSAMAGSEAGR